MKAEESAENYLETILMLSQISSQVRSIDVANELMFSRPSVSVAMKKLTEKKYIDIDAEGNITLTESGRNVAEAMYERHVLISDWLIFLGVDKKTAVSDACKMEHDISDESFEAIRKHIEEYRREVYTGKKETDR